MMYRDGEFEGQVYDDASPPELRNTAYIDPLCSVICLIEMGPLWIADKKFGQTVKLVQVKVFKQRSISSYAIAHDPDDVAMDDADEAAEDM